MIYLDSSALVKLVRVEAESLALSSWLTDRSAETPIASALVEVEVRRALRRSEAEALPSGDAVLCLVSRAGISARWCCRRWPRSWLGLRGWRSGLRGLTGLP